MGERAARQAGRESRRRILIIDDEKAVRDLVALHLANAGYDVASAEDAIVGARILLEDPVDLLIVDAHLPYWSGLDFVSTLIADGAAPCPPVIVITGRSELSARAELVADACLVKPFLSTQLLEAVAQCLGPKPQASEAGLRQAASARAA